MEEQSPLRVQARNLLLCLYFCETVVASNPQPHPTEAMNRLLISLFCFAPTISGYCTPGDLCWPNQAAWEELGASLDGELRAYAVPDVWN